MTDSTVVGVISDTHGLLRPEAIEALHGSSMILHAGDVGDRTIIEALETIAPVVAVRGNIDYGSLAQSLPETAVLEVAEVRILVTHILADLTQSPHDRGCKVVIYGHSHKPEQYLEDGILYLNPGSAGPRRFSLPITVAKLHIKDRTPQAELINLPVS